MFQTAVAAAIALVAAAPGVRAQALEIQTPDRIEIFDPKTLAAAFPVSTITTITPWAAAPIEYRGVRLSDIISDFEIARQPGTINIVARDAYFANIEVRDILEYKPILAYERRCVEADVVSKLCSSQSDFTPLPIAEKGPYFLVWPFTSLPHNYQTQRADLWVWYIMTIKRNPQP